VCPLAIIGVISTVGSILLHRGHRAILEQGIGQDLLIADDGGPRRIAAETRQVVLAGLRVEMGDADL
jgi:hypothetical protein